MKLSALLSIAWLVAVAPSVSATPGHGNKHHVVHEKRHAQHPSWKRHVAPPAADQVLPMKIGLKQRGLEHMDRYLLEVADPTSPRFGQHWTAQKVAATFAPDAAAVDQTLQWLADAGIDGARVRLSAGRNWVEFNATVREAEALLNTKYHMYKHTSGAVRTACEAYGVPAHVRRHVDFVMPTVQLDGMRTAKRSLQVMDPAAIQHAAGAAFLDLSPDDLTICDQLMTIGCMRALYGFPAGTTAQAGNQLGIAEWSDYLYLPDLDIFFSNWTSPPIPAGVRPEFISIDGGKIANATVAEAPFVFESAVDFQTAYSIIYPQGTRLYQIGDGVNVDDAGTFNIFLDALDASYCTYGGGDDPSVDPAYPDPQPGGYQGPKQCGGAPLSNVISFSYSQVEAELPVSYQRRQCNEWGKLALLGVSVIHSSGDAGVANRHNAGVPNSCLDEKGSIKTNGTRFSPGFPATCPYLTAVGATQVNDDVNEGEIAASYLSSANPLLNFYSGGGFSNIFRQPPWQVPVVSSYLSDHDPGYGPNVFNRTGRAYPDVAAIGKNAPVVMVGNVWSAYGTSVSAPLFASVVTLLNEQRLAARKKPLGFLNPILYQHPEIFNDITSGGNPGCGTQGFTAVDGWDPVTGLGTPNWNKMVEVLVTALP